MKRILKIKSVVAVVLVLSLLMSFPLSGCGIGTPEGEIVNLGGPDFDGEMDNRASAGDTFGSLLNNVTQDGSEANSMADLNPSGQTPLLSGFYQDYAEAQSVFVSQNLAAAFNQAGLQSSYENEIIRMDPIGFAETFFAILSEYDQGSAAMAAAMPNIFRGTDNWRIDLEEDAAGFMLIAYSNDAPVCGWQGFWDAEAQYLYCYFQHVDGMVMELDVTKTSHGFASQIYDTNAKVLYRLSFTNSTSWNGSIGFEIDAGQPALLTGTEGLDFAATATADEGTYVLISEKLLTVKQGQRDLDTYPLTSGTASTNSSSGTASTNSTSNTTNQSGASSSNSNSNSNSNSSGSNQANSSTSQNPAVYSRLWHASPIVGAGYSERFALYEDGTFLWGANDMDGASRIRYLAGTWSINNGELTMDCAVAVVWEGGKEQDNSNGHFGSYGSSVVITDYKTMIYCVEEQYVLPIGKIVFDSQREVDSVTIGELTCWDYSSQADYMFDEFWKIINSAKSKALALPAKPAAGIEL